METKLSSKGQITLPTAVRRDLNLETGDEVYVKTVGEDSILLEFKKKLPDIRRKATEAINASANIWKDRKDFDEQSIRKMRDADRKRLENLYYE